MKKNTLFLKWSINYVQINAEKDGKQIQSPATHRTSGDPNSLRFQVAKKKAKEGHTVIHIRNR